MARESLTLGPTPADEPCEQLGDNYNQTKARKECQVYREQLYRLFDEDFKNPELTVCLVIRGFEHDFGRYLEVVVDYDSENEKDVELAFKIEGATPGSWDTASIGKLQELGIWKVED